MGNQELIYTHHGRFFLAAILSDRRSVIFRTEYVRKLSEGISMVGRGVMGDCVVGVVGVLGDCDVGVVGVLGDCVVGVLGDCDVGV